MTALEYSGCHEPPQLSRAQVRLRRADRARGGRGRLRGRAQRRSACERRARRCGSPSPRSCSSCCRCSAVVGSRSRRPSRSGCWRPCFSFVDGRLIVFASGVYVAGIVAAFLLGNLRDAVQARIGLAVVVGGAAIVVYNDPQHTPGEFVFIPLLFVIAWLAGFALRERAAQAEAAEERAAHAERERESAARIAVAEERARIARELHDIVAHCGQRHGAPGRRRPAQAARRRWPRTGRRSRASSRPAARRWPRCAASSARCAATATGPRTRAAAGPRRASTPCSRRSAAPAFPCGCTSTATPSRSRARSTSPRTGSSRKA